MFKIIAGDFPEHTIIDSFSSILKLTITKGFRCNFVELTGNIQSLEIITEENKKKFIGTAGWGLVGAVALGPLGLLAGVLAGGNKKEICVACELKTGQKFIAVCDPKTHKKLLKASLETRKPTPSEIIRNNYYSKKNKATQQNKSEQPDSKPLGIDGFKKEAGANAFTLPPQPKIDKSEQTTTDYSDKKNNQSSKTGIILSIIIGLFFIITVVNNFPSDNTNVTDLRTTNKEKFNQGEKIIIKADVFGGTGKMASRCFRTSYGEFDSQPVIVFDKQGREWAIVLEKPEPESIFEKNLTFEGLFDRESEDPYLEDFDYVLTKAKIIE